MVQAGCFVTLLWPSLTLVLCGGYPFTSRSSVKTVCSFSAVITVISAWCRLGQINGNENRSNF